MKLRSTAFALLGLAAGGLFAPRALATTVAFSGSTVLLDDKPARIWGIRVGSASQSEALTDQLIANLDDYRRHGVNAVTVFYMGTLGASSDPFSPDGTLIDPAHRARMEKIIRACDKRGMLIVVGIFYQRVAGARLRDWAAAEQAVRTVTTALKPFRNVVLNPANEQNSPFYEQQPWKRVRDSAGLLDLCRIAKETDPRRLVGAGGYDHENNEAFLRSPHVDALLYDHGKASPSPGELFARFEKHGTGKPVMNVELFGGWTREHRPAGVYSEEAKQIHRRAVDEVLRTPGHHLFFHSSPWLQATTEPGTPIRFDLGGQGTAEDRGIRWFFEYLKEKAAEATGGIPAQRDGSAKRFRAVDAFQPVTDPAFAPYYRETSSARPNDHGVAIDTVRHAGKSAAAELTYAGEPGRFNLELTAVGEEDGESTYRLVIDGRALEQKRNHPVPDKRVPQVHRWGPLDLKTGDRIRVVFAGATNGKIPERDGTAWARGRWRALTLVPAAAVPE